MEGSVVDQEPESNGVALEIELYTSMVLEFFHGVLGGGGDLFLVEVPILVCPSIVCVGSH